MYAQHYSIQLEDPQEALPGNVVFADNSSSDVIGFVYDVYDDVGEFVFFEPTDISTIADQVIEVFDMEQDAWADMLHDALTRTTLEIRLWWYEQISGEGQCQ